jgi:hypothetical protein
MQDILERHAKEGTVPGAVALVARGDRVEVVAAGSIDLEGSAPMARDSIFRIASITKPITAAAVMMLVDDGRIALADRCGPGGTPDHSARPADLPGRLTASPACCSAEGRSTVAASCRPDPCGR